ncbi:DUF308 domain-containing protein [Actinopolymorpha cephalotaxi]|uniref:Uncharacterized membrane protein HdeD (DUF308 family) n=1 Tax=Actinopolymorpha cephalotaxi TaxID=504797 RepID=A0ABX2S7M2_9ACTN|nr:DUF308 domain-containing protein [Actinopolymorpha cephalotaxi]NYH84435.1 uncharacterized membrane protein HdeD (DUF308 family) [Actinopolymorpha cephalotaxi]
MATVLVALGDSWGAVLFLGCTSVLLGAAVVAWPHVSPDAWPSPTTRMIGVLLGAQILLYGLCHLLRAMAAPDVDGGRRVLVALLGIEALVVGVLLVRGVGGVRGTVAMLGLMAGLFWLVAGVIAALSEFVGRARPGRGPAMLGGLLGIGASIAVLSYPEASLTVAATVLGGYAVVLGALTIVQAFQVRQTATDRPAGRDRGRAGRGAAAGG